MAVEIVLRKLYNIVVGHLVLLFLLIFELLQLPLHAGLAPLLTFHRQLLHRLRLRLRLIVAILLRLRYRLMMMVMVSRMMMAGISGLWPGWRTSGDFFGYLATGWRRWW